MSNRITPFDEVVDLYVEKRQSIRQIAAAFTKAGTPMGYHDVRRILVIAEVSMRPRGWPTRADRHHSTS